MTPRVTIIMPVYNGERFVVGAITSVLNQSVRDWELIVIDDGSHDHTPSLVQSHDDLRIRYVRQANAGRSAARNRGLDLAQGDYILFLDADDTLLPHCLETHLDFLTSHPRCDGSISDCELVDEDGRVIVKQSALRQRLVPHYAVLPREGMDIFDPLVISAPLIGAPHTVLVHRHAIELSHARFDPVMFMGEDWDFWLQVADGAVFGFVDTVTCRYLWHSQNTVAVHDWAERHQSLLRGRRRVMSSSRFNSLSDDTKSIFFYQVLFELLFDQPEAQQQLLMSAEFERLAPRFRSRLLGQTGVESMYRSHSKEFTSWCLRLAASSSRRPWVEQALYLSWGLSPCLLRLFVRWRRSRAGSRNAKIRDQDIHVFLQTLETNH